MKKIFKPTIILMLLIFLFQVKLSAKEIESREYFPPVIMYHDIRPDPHNYMDVTVKDFAAQLDWLKQNGWKTLSIDEFIEITKFGKAFPKKSVLLTFDDGYKGVYTYAIPELKKRDMKATFFILVNFLDVLEGDYPYLTTELANDPLFSIGSHTLTHPYLNLLDEKEKVKEIAESKKFLEEIVGREVKSFAYPTGAYDKSVIKAVIAAGYDVAFSVQDRGILHELPRYSIPRIFVGYEFGQDNQKLFKKYVQTYREMPAAFAERWEPFE